MSDDQGPVKIPDALFEATSEDALRERREKEAVAAIEARVRAGELTVREADAELLKLVVADFEFLGEDVQAAIQRRGEALLEESPSLVESRRAVAAHYGARTGDDDEDEGAP